MNESPTQLLLRAATFAAEKHKSQLRKNAGGTPYINHPLAVAELLASEGRIGVLDLETLALRLGTRLVIGHFGDDSSDVRTG